MNANRRNCFHYSSVAMLVTAALLFTDCKSDFHTSNIYQDNPANLQLLGDEYEKLNVSEPLSWVFAKDNWDLSRDEAIEVGDISFTAEKWLPYMRPTRWDYSSQLRNRFMTTALEHNWRLVEVEGTVKVTANVWYAEGRPPRDIAYGWRRTSWNDEIGVELKLTDADGNTLFACVHRQGGMSMMGAWDNWLKDFFKQMDDLSGSRATRQVAPPPPAQPGVRLVIERDRYLLYEPVMATVHVDNPTAQPLELIDRRNKPWLQVDLLRPSGQRVTSARRPLKLETATLKPGQTQSLSINLAAFYNLRELGPYRAGAIVIATREQPFWRSIFHDDIDTALLAPDRSFEVVPGRELWSKTQDFLGIDKLVTTRTYRLIELQSGSQSSLYARTEAKQNQMIYGVLDLGLWDTTVPPQAELDRYARLHVLHQVSPHNLQYVIISPTAAILKREFYADADWRPQLRREADGEVFIIGVEKK